MDTFLWNSSDTDVVSSPRAPCTVLLISSTLGYTPSSWPRHEANAVLWAFASPSQSRVLSDLRARLHVLGIFVTLSKQNNGCRMYRWRCAVHVPCRLLQAVGYVIPPAVPRTLPPLHYSRIQCAAELPQPGVASGGLGAAVPQDDAHARRHANACHACNECLSRCTTLRGG